MSRYQSSSIHQVWPSLAIRMLRAVIDRVRCSVSETPVILARSMK